MKYDIGYYTEQCYSAFKQLQVKSNYSINGIRANICEWLKKKEPLFNLLRKHPLWNEEAKAVVFECTEVREIDTNIFYKAMEKLEYLIVNILPFSYINSRDFYEITHSEDETIYLDKLSAVYDILIYLHEKPEEHISSATATYINTYSLLNCYTKYKVKSGQKTSRAINKICTELGVDKLDGYNKIFAEISDALTPLSINRKCILSANFMDFMTMANGNSWTTCHNIGIEKNKIGSYAAGPAFYGTDEVSLIFYTLDNENITEKYFMQPKVTRQIFFYQNGTLIQERLYPKTHDNDCVNDKNSLSAIYRKTVESVISRCEDKPDMWREADVRIQRNDNCLMYPDWECFYNWRMQLNGKDGTSLITVGGDTYCFQCGQPKTDNYTKDIRCSVCIDGIAFN